MTTKQAPKTQAQRIAARINAREAKRATARVRSAQSYRRYAEQARLAGNTEQAERMIANAELHEAAVASMGRCVRCGRLLSDPKSVAGSIGPECAKKAA